MSSPKSSRRPTAVVQGPLRPSGDVVDAEVRLPITVEVEPADHHTVTGSLKMPVSTLSRLYSTILGSETFTDRILMVRLRAL